MAMIRPKSGVEEADDSSHIFATCDLVSLRMPSSRYQPRRYVRGRKGSCRRAQLFEVGDRYVIIAGPMNQEERSRCHVRDGVHGPHSEEIDPIEEAGHHDRRWGENPGHRTDDGDPVPGQVALYQGRDCRVR